RTSPGACPGRSISCSTPSSTTSGAGAPASRSPAWSIGERSTEDPMDKAERILGGVASRVLFENERVRIWEMDLAPGASSDVHRHDVDYVLVQIEGDRIAAQPEPDTQGKYNEYLEADVVPGKAHYIR